MASQKTNPSSMSVYDMAIRLLLLLALLWGVLYIVQPFLVPVLWAAILAIAIYPLHQRLQALLGGRQRLASTLITLLALTGLLVPVALGSLSTFESVSGQLAQLEQGTLEIAPPREKLRDWPLVGERIYSAWEALAADPRAYLKAHEETVRKTVHTAIAAAEGLLEGTLLFAVSLIIMGVFLPAAGRWSLIFERLAARLSGNAEMGRELLQISIDSIRSVANGVVGVAIIQGVAFGLVSWPMGVPYLALWAGLVMLLTILQLPALIVIGPVIAYVFAQTDGIQATVYAIIAVLIGMSDVVLKPMLLGKGVVIPMPVILIGALGGMFSMGLIGLFTGTVIVSLGYLLLRRWLDSQAEAVREV